LPSSPRRWHALVALLLLNALGCETTPEKKVEPVAVVKDAPPEPATTPELKPEQRLSLERVFADPPLAGRSPMGVSFSPDGGWLAFLKGSETDSDVLDLWAMRLRPNGEADGEPRVLVKTRDLVQSVALSEEERMANERKRVRHTGITSYSWCGKAGDAVLFPLSGALYHVDVSKIMSGEGPKVSKLTADEKPRLDPQCSAKGSLVAFASEGDLYVIDVATKREKKLTKGATDTRRFAVAEFVAQEEVGRFDGHWFSPSERYIAYTEVDLSPVGVKTRPRIYADRTEMFEQRYPAAGEANAKVKIHVHDLKTGQDRVVKGLVPSGETDEGYIARVGFYGDDRLYVQWQSRDQKRLILYTGPASSLAMASVLEETDAAWVELHDDLHFLKDGRFIWPSERTGTRQLFLVTPDGKKGTALTMGDAPVEQVVAVDEENARIFYIRATDQSRQRQLFSTSLAGGDAGPSLEKQITHEPGTHDVVGASNGRAFVDTFSRMFMPPRVTLHNASGERLYAIEENPADELKKIALPTPGFFTLAAEDGTPLNGLLLPPVPQVPGKRYPVMVYVYGGPHAQVVTDRWSRLQPFFAYMCQQGYGVFLVDNRGSGGRNRAFTRSIHRRFGDIEVKDQIRAVEHLKGISWVDADRIGVFGWSYGGYMSALLAMEENTPFAAAAAVAPVTDWRLYDTHYTERYIGTPATDAELYARAAVTPRATRLQRPLLLVHGMADDNVLFENSLSLMEALQEESIPFELMVYPGRAHGLRGRGTQLHVFRTIAGFFDRTLKQNEAVKE